MHALVPSTAEAELAAIESLLLELYGLSYKRAGETRLDRVLAATLHETPHECGWDLIDSVRVQGAQGATSQRLLAHATVGESYFLRHGTQIAALRETILPGLIKRRSKEGKRLRIWSAGCSTGEEVYTVAILLRELIPDLDEWCITLVGTDICVERIEKAERGVYGAWSFREAPSDFIDENFRACEGGLAILPEIRSMATFELLNLATDDYPSMKTNTFCIDLVLARNVLMYMNEHVSRRIVSRLIDCLAVEGVALFGPSDCPDLSGASVLRRNTNGVAYYVRPTDEPPGTACEIRSADGPRRGIEVGPFIVGAEREPRALDSGRAGGEPQPGPLMTVALRESPSDTAQLLSRMKQLADGGEFERALSLCETHGAALRLVPDFHLLTALIHVEIGNLEEALEALGRTLFLDESCVLAQVLKAVCLRRLGRSAAARRWCRNAARHLESISDDALISGLDAVFAGDCKVLLSGLFEGKPGHV